MRRGLAMGAVVGALNAGLAVLLGWWFGRRPGEFGWYSYSPMPPRYSDYFPSRAITPTWEIVLVTAVAFLVLNVTAIVLVLRLRGRAEQRAD